jgi:hypothetical protein
MAKRERCACLALGCCEGRLSAAVTLSFFGFLFASRYGERGTIERASISNKLIEGK